MNQRTHYSRTVAPTTEPLTLDDAVRHLQLAVSDDNAYITALIATARDVTESITGRALITSTWLAVCQDWPEECIELIVAPVTAVASVKYYAYGETSLTTVDSADYTVSTAVAPAVITFGEDFDFPELANRPDAVQITFTAGHATATAVPPSLKHALRVMIRHYYDHPETVASGSFNELPFGLKNLLELNRVSGWVA